MSSTSYDRERGEVMTLAEIEKRAEELARHAYAMEDSEEVARRGELFLLRRLREAALDWRLARLDPEFEVRSPGTEGRLLLAARAVERYRDALDDPLVAPLTHWELDLMSRRQHRGLTREASPFNKCASCGELGKLLCHSCGDWTCRDCWVGVGECVDCRDEYEMPGGA